MMNILRRVASPALSCKFGVFLSLLLVVGLGCSGPRTVTVNGKVVSGGQPVTGGTLVFTPQAAPGGAPVNPAMVEIKADGTFSSRSVVLGRNQLSYVPPAPTIPPGGPKGNEPPPGSTAMRLVPKQPEIDVTAGGPPLEIDLVPGT